MNVSNFKVGSRRSVTTSHLTSYQLQITNLYHSRIEFAVETCVARNPDRNFVGEMQMFLGEDFGPYPLANTWTRRGEAMVNTQQFTLEPDVSTTFNIALVGMAGMSPSEKTINGFVRLRVPIVRAPGHFVVNSQSPDPVPVLLSASQIDSRPLYKNYIRNLDGVTQYQLGGSDWYSTQSIPLASGKAENLIESEGFHFSDVVNQVSNLRDLMYQGSRIRGALDIAEAERVPALLDLLANFADDRTQISAVNELLSELGSQIHLRTNG